MTGAEAERILRLWGRARQTWRLAGGNGREYRRFKNSFCEEYARVYRVPVGTVRRVIERKAVG